MIRWRHAALGTADVVADVLKWAAIFTSAFVMIVAAGLLAISPFYAAWELMGLAVSNAWARTLATIGLVILAVVRL